MFRVDHASVDFFSKPFGKAIARSGNSGQGYQRSRRIELYMSIPILASRRNQPDTSLSDNEQMQSITRTARDGRMRTDSIVTKIIRAGILVVAIGIIDAPAAHGAIWIWILNVRTYA